MNNSYNNEYLPFNLDKMVTNVVKLLKQNGLTVSTAESCTGRSYIRAYNVCSRSVIGF